MKKVICSLLLIIILIGIVACGESEEGNEDKREVNIYFLNKEETKLVSVLHYIEQGDIKEQIESVIHLLQTQPEELELKACIGKEPLISKLILIEGRAIVTVKEEYDKLSSTTEVLMRAAIVRTLTQFHEIENVSIEIEDNPLLDTNGLPIGAMTADSFINNSGSELNDYEKVDLALYYTDEFGDVLVRNDTSQVYNSNDSMEKLIVEQLINGSEDKELLPTINPKTKIISITSKDGICYLNLSKEFLEPVQNTTWEVAIYSLVNSLVELSNINKVQILVDGTTDIMYRESISLTTIFERNLDIVK